MHGTTAEATLKNVNLRLGELLDLDPLELTTGAGVALTDHLWVWGILGGKDVGKSTLIDALAGAGVTAGGERPGEGTCRPTAFLCAQDRAALEARLQDMPEEVIYRTTAPAAMRGLVLIDLPDYDSLFDSHIQVVRSVARLLDGIIWVTTPKKVADIRGISEIQQVLKDRDNFVYVVNKIDWLLAQSNGTPAAALEHMRTTLDRQVAASDAAATAERTFLISARHRTSDDALAVIAQSRNLDSVTALREQSPDMIRAVAAATEDFKRLSTLLTSPPTAESTETSKQANLEFQLRVQRQRICDHFKPQDHLEQLRHASAEEEISEVVTRAIPPSYTEPLLRRLHNPARLFSSWSTTLFRERISRWSVLGAIAWPLALVGALIDGIRSALPAQRDDANDVFQADGSSLEQRMGAVVDGVKRRLAGTPFARLELPTAAQLTRQFRVQVNEVAEGQRMAALAPFVAQQPHLVGRMLRRLGPYVVILWFPFGQPLAAAGLALADDGLGMNIHTARVAVEALSANQVLAGLVVAVLILMALVGAVFSKAARDSLRARERLLEGDGTDVAPLNDIVVSALRRPIQQVEETLQHNIDQLNALH